MHRIYLETAPADQDPSADPSGGPVPFAAPGDRITITGDEARHAVKAKRLDVRETVEILNGRGIIARATILRAGPDSGPGGRRAGWAVEVEITSVTPIARVRPRVEVWSATPKGARVDELIDGLSQVGAAAWTPIATERGVVSPRDSKLERLERTAWEAAKQCARPWALQVGHERPFEAALRAEADVAIVLADGAGAPYRPARAAAVRILIGPEGGWSEAELALARELGIASVRFGPHIMRIETAAVVATAVVLDQEGRAASLAVPGEPDPDERRE